jgi:tetratricopeptide (TPR) repeat protein
MKTMFLMKRANWIKAASMAFASVLFFGHAMAQTPEMNEARRLIDNEQYPQAIAKLNTALAAAPKDERADYLMGKAYFLMEKYNDASTWFTKGMGHSARYPMNFVGTGAVEVKRDQLDAAKGKLTEAAALNKDNDPVVFLAIAEAYMGYNGKNRKRQADYLKEAELYLYKVQRLNPNDARSYVLLGQLYGLQGVEELEQSSYEGAISRDPKLKEAYLRLGQLYKKQKKYNEAAEMFGKAIEIDNTYAPPFREMAEMWFLAKKYDRAEENMGKYLAIMGNDKAARMRACIFQYSGEQYDNAIPCMENMLKDTTAYVLNRLIGYSYVKKASPDADKALASLDTYFKIAPPAAIIPSDYEMKARAEKLKGMTAEAVADFEKAIQLAAADSTIDDRNDLYIDIAELYKEKKDHANRAIYTEKFLQTEKAYNLKESFNLGLAYYSAQNFAKSDSVFKLMTENKPELHVGWVWRGKCNVQLDPDSKLGLAKPYLEKAKELISAKEETKAKQKDDYLFCLKYLAAYYTLVANDCPTAMPLWNEIIQLKPEDEQAANGLKFCQK